MQQSPPLPPVADAPDGLLADGHLWLQEYVAGAPLRVQLSSSGLLTFATDAGVHDDPGDVPPAYRHAVRHVRERLDRDALRAAVPDVERLAFVGVATQRAGVDYDWDRLPSFLGVDVWDGDRFRPPDAVEQIFEGVGLHPVNAFEREVRARDFDPDDYAVPASAWRDGPAAGVVVRDKQGRRAKLANDDAPETQASVAETAGALADAVASRERLEELAGDLDDATAGSFETTVERAVEDGHRRRPEALADGGRHGIDEDAFRAAVRDHVRAFLDG